MTTEKDSQAKSLNVWLIPLPYNVQFFDKPKETLFQLQHVGHQLYLKPYLMSNTVAHPSLPECESMQSVMNNPNIN
jgi:hypothetical protein